MASLTKKASVSCWCVTTRPAELIPKEFPAAVPTCNTAPAKDEPGSNTKSHLQVALKCIKIF